LWRHELGSITRIVGDRRAALELLQRTSRTPSEPGGQAADGRFPALIALSPTSTRG
jgi:hypothetical protein